MKKILPLLIIPLMLVSCAEQKTHTAFMMDTVITYDIAAENCDKLFDFADMTVTELEKKLSSHYYASEVSVFNSRVGDEISEVTADIVKIALSVSHATDGAYDITVAPLVKLWNITDSAENFTPPTDEVIRSLLPAVGYKMLTLDGASLSSSSPDVQIDLGGIAKGYTCGLIAQYMSQNGAVGTVNFGGNVAVVGKKDGGFRIGIKDPADPDTLCGVLTLEAGMVAVSGGYERYAEYNGVRYHHIIDPKNGYPSESELASAAVIAPSADAESGALADALSTALFVMGKDKAMELYEMGIYDFEAVLIANDGEITVTDGLKERFEEN